MKAIRVAEVGPADVMKLEEVPDPKPGAGQVVVKIAAVGVNPVDTYVRSGKYPLKASLPYTPGQDCAGTIASVGPGVSSVKAGDRVYVSVTLSGAYASMALCPESGVHPLPAHLSFQQGAAVGIPYATAWTAVHLRGQAIPNEWVLIHGASGGVGIAAIQIAKAWGMRIIGTAGTGKGRELIMEQGADHALDHSSPNYLASLPSGPDLIIEMLANVNLNKDLGILAANGRIVIVGNRGTVEIDPRQAMMRNASILGMSMNNATPEHLKKVHAAIGAGLANRSLNPIVGKELPLAEAARAHELILARGSHGKIVLIP